MNRQQMEIYATVLLKKGINLQENQILVINAPVESHEFVSVLAEKAYESGASQVVLNWRSNTLTMKSLLLSKTFLRGVAISV